MKFALDHSGDRVYAYDASKQEEYFCPICRQKVMLRKGKVNVEHFYHKSKCDDTWNYDMSEWHSEWQQQFPQKNQEVVVEFDGEKHRADVMACGYVIEFQHSLITAEEFDERNRFYLNYGKKVIWVFDFYNEFECGHINCYDEWVSNNDNGGKFKWNYPKRFLQSYVPQKNENIIVFFQFFDSKHSSREETYMERITWAIEEDGCSNFKRFCTSYYPGNCSELIAWIKEHKL